MEAKKFWLQLGLLTLTVVTLVVVVSGFDPVLLSLLQTAFVIVATLVAFNIILYSAAQRAALATNKNTFIRLTLVGSMTKFFLAFAFIAAYKIRYQVFPPRQFALIFILIYVPYTIFEAYYMAKVAKQ